jgi:hypothetical protein
MAESVRLKLARREFFSGGGFSGTYAPFSVKVKNIAFSKEVVVHYTPYGDTWKDFALTFSSHFGDYDVFGGTVNEQVMQFVIRYSSGGETFFDNNAGQDYRFVSNLAAVGGNVMLNYATAKQGNEAGGGFVFTTSWLEGEILVNNLAFAKDVGVRFSTDGGGSWHDSSGFFAGSQTSSGIFVGAGVEVWRFKTPVFNLNAASPTFHFAVFYRNLATGDVFWDNNFGQAYKVSKVNGATIE